MLTNRTDARMTPILFQGICTSLVIVAIFALVSCTPEPDFINSEKVLSVEDTIENKGGAEENVVIAFDCTGQHIEFENIRFRCNPDLGTKIVVTRPPDSPLEDEQDKADFVRPSFLNFRFLDGNAYSSFKNDYYAEIQVFRIDEFRRMYSIAAYRVNEFDKEIEALRTMLKTPANELGKLPSPLYPVKQFPVFPVIGEQHLVKAKFEAVPFRDGD